MADGRTFLAVDVIEKTGVDPHFQFDVDAMRTASVRLFDCTSDHYFSRLAGTAQFDLVFLDGLHVFETTFRNFSARGWSFEDISRMSYLDFKANLDLMNPMPEAEALAVMAQRLEP